MNVLALLACLALCACALGVLGLARVGKPRRSLRAIERTCLLDPLSLPAPAQPCDDARALSRVETAATFLRSRIPLLLAPLARVEQGGADPAAAASPAALGILPFLASQPLVQAILRLSGLSLLMANQHERSAPAVVTVDNYSGSTYSATATELSHATKRVDTRDAEPTTASDRSDSEGEDYDDASSDSDEESDKLSSSSSSMFERSAVDAQHAFFDGLQFYNVLSQVGSATVSAVVQQAMRNTAASVAHARAQATERASITAIEQRYPDILCLSQPAHAQTSARTDLATVLLAVTAAMQQQQQQRTASQSMPCGSMERRLSTKRPDSLALAQGDGMEPARRTPLTSPASASSSASQIEASFLQAA